jgi:hypothetical protein
MTIEVGIDATALVARVNDMIGKISHFKRVDIGAGLSDFQTQDMHRNRPFTMRSRGKGAATTKIRPHSLYETQHSGKVQRRVRRVAMAIQAGKRVRRRSLQALKYTHFSTRPILREEMFEVLGVRMSSLLVDKITWKAR